MSIGKPKPELEFYRLSTETPLELPYMPGGISAGFPSPAMDFMESRIDLNKLLIKDPDTTFYARVSGDSMINAGIGNDDILVIDRSLKPEDKRIAICFIDGEFTVKRLKFDGDDIYLIPENEAYQPIKITPEHQFSVWGIVVYVIKKL